MGSTSGFVNAVQPNGSNPSGSTPQAFLTILFFDERFNFIESADGGVYQQQVETTVGSNGATLALQDKKAPKNGYVYAYISNQSNNYVYFDNFKVGITQGNIVEENHYYSYGLKIAAISSRKLGDSYEGNLKNKYLYQGTYSEFDEETGWSEFDLRTYDSQIGRWTTPDPYQEFASGYIGMGGDPLNNTDPSGGIITSGLFAGMSELGRSAVMTIGGAILGQAAYMIGGGEDFKGALIGSGVGFGASLIGSFDWGHLLNGSTAINFFVTGTKAYLSSVSKWDAQRLDKTWAVTKSIFSFGCKLPRNSNHL